MADGNSNNSPAPQDDYLATIRSVIEAFRTQVVTQGDLSVFLMAAPVGYIAPFVVALPLSITASTSALLIASFAVGVKKGIHSILRMRARRNLEHQREIERMKREELDRQKVEQAAIDAKAETEQSLMRAQREDPKVKLPITSEKLIKMLTEYQLHREANFLKRELELHNMGAISVDKLAETIGSVVDAIRNKEPLQEMINQ